MTYLFLRRKGQRIHLAKARGSLPKEGSNLLPKSSLKCLTFEEMLQKEKKRKEKDSNAKTL